MVEQQTDPQPEAELKPEAEAQKPETSPKEKVKFLDGIEYSGPDKITIQIKGEKGAKPKEKEVDVAALWNQFTRQYTKGGKDSLAVKAANMLNRITFGDGVEAFVKPYDTKEITDKLAKVDEQLAHISGDAPGAADLLKEKIELEKASKKTEGQFALAKGDIEAVALAAAALSVNKKARPLHRLIEEKLVDQWIELEKQPQHGLYPPPVISTSEGVTLDEKATILAARDVLSKSKPGSLLAGSLLMLEEKTLKAQSVLARKKLPDNMRKRVTLAEIVKEAEDITSNALFKYDPVQGATFNSYVVGGLQFGLKDRVLRNIFDLKPGKNVPDDAKPTGKPSSEDTDRPVKKTPVTVSIHGRSEDDPHLSIGANLEQTRELQPDEQADLNMQRAVSSVKLGDALRKLKPRERMIIELRHGLGDNVEQTLEQIGALLGVTKECVRQTEVLATAKLEFYMLNPEGERRGVYAPTSYKEVVTRRREQRTSELE